MNPADRLLGLIQQLYAAPGTAEGWLPFLESLRIALHGSSSSLLCEDLRSQQCSVAATTTLDPEAIGLYNKQWGSADPWAHSPSSGRLAQPGVIVGDELIAHRDVQRTAYYEDFARRYDVVRALIGVLEMSPTALSVISVSGSERRGPFCERDVALLGPLVPHVRRALQLHRRLVAASRAADDLSSAIDQLSRAVLLIDAEGRVTFMNRAASRLIAMRDGLTVEQGALRAASASDTMRLRSTVAEAVRTSSGFGFGAGGMLAIGRPSGRRALSLLVCPVSQRRTLFPGVETAAAMVFVADPEQIAVPDEDTLRTLFGLTRAEAKLTRLLAQGESLMEAGERLGLRRETVRSRLKAIFEKTNTHSQGELVRLVLNGTPRS
ncbi:MAG TPA: helix-turn-helix transcriptional regulator [Vicinamibacterales bacterium]|nr:helix-turn-helix transcriptional regulator [Vicinamibacterales bacterium]